MKKYLSALAVTTVLLTSAPMPAQAVVSIFAGGAPLAIAGAVLLGSSQMGVMGYRCVIGVNYCFSGGEILLGAALGIAMLDEQGELKLSEMTEAQAAKIGVTAAEAREFNASRTALEQVSNEVNSISTTAEEAALNWKSHIGDTVSKEAFDVYVKVIAAESK